ncbi:MAG: DedA family protein [Candidatus Saccharimonadales bacterium]
MDVGTLLESFGYFIIFLSVFIESGVILGLVLPLPGFSLLFAAGVFATTDKLSLLGVIVTGSLAAILGYVVGYYTGLKYGRKLLYEKKTERYFTAKQGKAAEKFMKKYGYSTLVIGRWLPVLHSVAPLLSGIARTPFTPFMITNIVGGILWVLSSTLLGYYIGQVVPNAQYYIIPFVAALVIIVNTSYGKRLANRITKKVEEM